VIDNTIVVLVTGVGDTVGQAVLKAARACTDRVRIVATDADPGAAGLAWADVAVTLPHSGDRESYLAALTSVCLTEGVDVVFPTSERELVVVSAEAGRLSDETGAHIVAASSSVLEVALDKWETCRFLARQGLAHPAHARPEHPEEVDRLVADVGYPLLVKPRRGTGSRGVQLLATPDDLGALRAEPGALVLQELLGTADEEFSAATWTCLDGTIRGPVSYRRGLVSAGDTAVADVRPHHDVDVEARGVARALGILGPCNVQLRRTPRGPVTFEINPRFSGGASIRAHFGFNEVEMAVTEHARGRPVPPPTLSTGTARRFWAEQYVDEVATS